MHQYVERARHTVVTEQLFGDRIVNFLYSRAREKAPSLFRLATSARVSSLLGFVNFDLPLADKIMGNRRFLARHGVDLHECLDPPASFTCARKIFERKIRYPQCRPMLEDDGAVVSPADARMLCGTMADGDWFSLKGKFFEYRELLGDHRRKWQDAFSLGECAIFRLTPDKYHYNHVPVSGRVVEFYEISGDYHSCNPGAVVEMVTPYSKNKRVVTIIDTDVPEGTRIGLVAMVEVVALMIGDVVQCYSESRGYDFPMQIQPGMFLRKGQPKSLFRPGSSTDILLFQPGRVVFAEDLVTLMRRPDVASRFSIGFGGPLAEVDVRVRSLIGRRRVPNVR
jgi:phosphatidylserine decarboxylase